jgi:hypothetical protein
MLHFELLHSDLHQKITSRMGHLRQRSSSSTLRWEVINPSRHSFFAYETTSHQPRRTIDLVFDCPLEDALSSSSDATEELEACSSWYLKSVAAQHLPGLLRVQSSLGGTSQSTKYRFIKRAIHVACHHVHK